MPRGDKSVYTDKQKRKAEHIEDGYEDCGLPEKETCFTKVSTPKVSTP